MSFIYKETDLTPFTICQNLAGRAKLFLPNENRFDNIMSPSAKPVAFLGATGGSINAALVLALKDGYRCTALARTPQKLNDMLIKKGISQNILTAQLRITKGDIRDLEAVKKVFYFDTEQIENIVCGIGMVLGRGIDLTICQAAAGSILAALEELRLPTAPHLSVISTTGIAKGPRDVPIAFLFMYHILLATPHADKRVMEELVSGKTGDGLIDGYTVVRPSLLTSGKSRGMQKIRVGSEDEPAVGYTISRDDVGLWIYEELIKGDCHRWNGTKPTISY